MLVEPAAELNCKLSHLWRAKHAVVVTRHIFLVHGRAERAPALFQRLALGCRPQEHHGFGIGVGAVSSGGESVRFAGVRQSTDFLDTDALGQLGRLCQLLPLLVQRQALELLRLDA